MSKAPTAPSLLLLMSLVSLAAATWPAIAADFFNRGPLAVGFEVAAVPKASGNGKLHTLVWYPAAGPVPDPATASAAVRLLGIKDASPATTGPFPLVVLIHGLGGSGGSYALWGQQLASYGFVVIAGDYGDYDLSLQSGSDPVLGPEDQVAVHLLHERPADVMVEIAYADQLTAPDGRLAGVIDTSHVGVWGHSTGGSTALQAAGAQIDFKALDAWCADKGSDLRARETCRFVGHEPPVAALYGATDAFAAPMPPLWDKRVSALVLAAPGGELHAFGDAGIASVKVPTLIMVSSADAMVKPEYNAIWAFGAIGSASKTLAVFADGSHEMFLLDCCGYYAKRDGPRLDELKALTTAFFLDILKNDQAGRAALSPAAVSFPTLTYQTTMQ